MAQKLILPIHDCAFSAAYKNPAYLKQQGYSHYGVDLYSLSSNQAIYACGDGEVVACGLDGQNRTSRLGNCIVIIYKDAELHNGKIENLACRMFHFDKINVVVGQKVTKDSIIGYYGNTGGTTVNGKPMGYHLHIEFDTDIKYPCHAYGISASGNVIKKGSVDSTINPSDVWYLSNNQTIKGIYQGWFSSSDVDLPKINDDLSLLLTELEGLIKKYKG